MAKVFYARLQHYHIVVQVLDQGVLIPARVRHQRAGLQQELLDEGCHLKNVFDEPSVV